MRDATITTAEAVARQLQALDAPRVKPRSATVVQAAAFVIAAATAALHPLLMLRLGGLMDARRHWNRLGLDAGESEVTALELARNEFPVEYGIVLALPAVIALLALVTAIGLQRGRRWARILGALWSGLLLLPIATWAAGSIVLLLTVTTALSNDYDVGPLNPFALNAIAGTAALAAVVCVFVLLLSRRLRRWTPPRRVPPLPEPPESRRAR
jgi:NADH:ubiquinone oxidoreductase subunit 3 (subunit A)